MRMIILLSLHILCAVTANAYRLCGTVTDEAGRPVEYATVAAICKGNGKIATCAVTDSTGQFAAQLLAHEYSIRFSCIGYETKCIDVAIHTNKNLGEIILTEDATTLDEVTVTATRPAVKRVATGMVVTVNGIRHLQNKTLDRILNMSPGVFVGNDGGISINGNSVNTVIVNDRTIRLNGDQLMAYLKSIQGSDLQKIEIMQNPTSAYDAEGTGGIIKITTARQRDMGVTGYASMGYSFARRATYNPSAGIAYNLGKVTLYGNYSFTSHRNVWQRSQNDFYNDGIQANYNTEHATDHHDSHVFRIGLDYDINRLHYIGIEYNGGRNEQHNTGSSTATVYNSDVFTQQIDATSQKSNNPRNDQVTLNYTWQIDTLGQTLKFIADYSGNAPYDNSTSYYDNTYSDGTILEKREIQDENARIYSAQLDYEKPFAGTGWKLATGIKFSRVKNSYNYKLLTWQGDERPAEDERFTDRFRFSENLYAAYANANFDKNKLSGNVGLRAEYTRREGASLVRDEVNTTDETRLFPSAFVYYKPNDTHGLMAYYGMRINRPNYRMLNPFTLYITDLSYRTGNPDLKPEISNVIELTYVLKNKYYMSLRANFTDNRIRDYTYTNGEYTVLTTNNLTGYKWYYINTYIPYGYKIWNGSILLNMGTMDSQASGKTRRKTFTMEMSVNNYFYFSDNIGAQLQVLYSLPYKDVYQTWHKHIAEVNVSMDYTFGKGPFMLSLGIDDIFNMLRHRHISYSYPGLSQEVRTDGLQPGRTFYASLKLNFSTKRRVAQKHKNRSNQDEINRL